MSGHNKVVCSSRENFTEKINGSRVRAGGTDGMEGQGHSSLSLVEYRRM